MKRLVSIILLIAMFLTLPVYASTYPGAEELKKLNLIRGGENGDLMVERTLTRAEAATLLAHLYGKFEEASKYSYNSGKKFNDVKSTDWFAPFVGYANINNWMLGTPDGNFNPNQSISRQMWATILLRVLNSYNSWETAERDLANLGIIISTQRADRVLRGEAFDAMWAAVNTKPKGETRILGEVLGAIKPAVVEVTPELIKVETPSLQTVKLSFNTKLNKTSAEDVNNYQLVSGIKKIQIASAKYDDLSKTVLLTLTENQTQQSVANFSMSVQSEDNKYVVQKEFGTVQMLDLIPPTVKSITSIGSKAVKVEFSEPVVSLTNPDIKVSTQQAIRTVTLSSTKDTAIIEFYADLNGTVSIQIKDSVRDFAGYGVVSQNFSVKANTNKTPPVVVSTEDVTSTSVTLVWSKDISSANPSASMYKNVGPSDGQATKDGNKTIVSFTNHFIQPGTTNLVVEAGAVTDYSGVSNKSQLVTITVPQDDKAPYLKDGVKVISENTIHLIFSEPLDNRTSLLNRVSEYKLFDANGYEIPLAFRQATYNSKTNTIELITTKNMLGSYRVAVANIKDHAGNTSVVDTGFQVADMQPPAPSKWSARVYNSGKSDQMIKIRFDEPMQTVGHYSITSLENFVIQGKQLDKLDQSLIRVEVVDNDSSIEIYYPGETITGGITFKGGASSIIIGRLADKAGNYTESFSTTLALNGSGNIKIEKIEQVTGNNVSIYFDDTLTNADFTDFVLNGTILPIDGVLSQAEDGKSIITLTFKDPVPYPAQITVKNTRSTNKYGEVLSNSGNPISVVDKVGPVVAKQSISGESRDAVSYDQNRGVITITFNENIDARTVSLLTFSVPGIQLENFTVSGKEVKLHVAASDRRNVKLYDIVRQEFELRDMSGNGTTGIVVNIQRIY